LVPGDVARTQRCASDQRRAYAGASSISPRNSARRFAQAMRMPPARCVQSLRIDATRRLLTGGALPIERVAERCGFASLEFRRRFRSSHG
jgi:transcriptional regulator GlxA family with amidase domain